MSIPTNPIFPSTLPGLGLPVTRTPVWGTLIQESLAGVELAIQPQTYPRYRYGLTYAVLRQATLYQEVQALMGFYNRMGGRALVFQYQDPQDSIVPTDQVVATGDSTQVAFQLVRARGGFVEPVFAVDSVTNVKVGGVIYASSKYSVSDRGIVTLSTKPSSTQNVAWNGVYNWFCRFDQDSFDFSQITAAADSQGPLWEAKAISFATIKFGA